MPIFNQPESQCMTILPSMSAEQILQTFTTLSTDIIQLNFVGPQQRKTSAEIKQIFSRIPGHVTTFSLKSLRFYNNNNNEFTAALAVIPTNITGLDLSYCFGLTPADILASILAAVPMGVTHLELQGYFTKQEYIEQQASALGSIPANVTSLGLGESNLGAKTVEEIATLLAKIPTTVTCLDLSGNKLSEELITTLLSLLADNIKTITVDGHTHIKTIVAPCPDPVMEKIAPVPKPETETEPNSEKNSTTQSSDSVISMQVFAGFITAIGITAVALAFTVLNAAALGIAGLLVAGLGVAATLVGLGMFAYNASKNNQEIVDEDNQALNCK